MTLTKRIIPCLDVKNGRVVKGLHFESIKDAGDPVELAEKYSNDGADELVFLDITASDEQRKTIKELVKKVASVIDIPFTVGGGVKSIEDARNILLNGADKVGINTGAIKNPKVIVLPSSMKVPHMGWNDLEIKKPGKLLEGVENGSWVYFVHSYRVKPSSDDIITAESDYGIKVPAVVEQDNFFGTQFHPEKSSSVGKIMLKNFLDVCKK